MLNKILPLIQHLSKEVFSKNAHYADTGKFPAENFDAIKQHGLHLAMVPKQYGGLGLNFYEYQKCLVEIAKGCASTASAFNMHNIVMGSLSDLSKRAESDDEKTTRYLKRIFDLVISEKAMIAAATTENNVGARFSKVKTHYRYDNGGFVLHGKKSFVTMSSYADYFLVLANKYEENSEIESNPVNLTYFLVGKNQPGVSIQSNWDTMAMRGTDSGDVIFDNVILEKSSVLLGKVGFALSSVMREPHWITGGYLGVYLGIMEAAFDFVIMYLQERSDLNKQAGLAYLPLVQARVAEMYSMLNSVRLTVFDAANRVVSDPGTQNTNRAIYLAKYLVGEMSPKLLSLAMRTCGGNSIRKQYPLERFYRDSQCARLMPAVSDVCQYYIGRQLLSVESTADIW